MITFYSQNELNVINLTTKCNYLYYIKLERTNLTIFFSQRRAQGYNVHKSEIIFSYFLSSKLTSQFFIWQHPTKCDRDQTAMTICGKQKLETEPSSYGYRHLQHPFSDVPLTFNFVQVTGPTNVNGLYIL